MKLEEGRYYETRCGDIAGPVSRTERRDVEPSSVYIFNGGNGRTYTADGHEFEDNESDNDLLREAAVEAVQLTITPRPGDKVGSRRRTAPIVELSDEAIVELTMPDIAPPADAKDAVTELSDVNKLFYGDGPDVKAAILEEAGKIVNGARRSAYGTPERNFERIARFWQAYFENTGRGDVNITAADVSPLMRLMKEARLCESPTHRDSFVDIIGYALTGAEVNGVKADA